jgi:hypothetical protein
MILPDLRFAGRQSYPKFQGFKEEKGIPVFSSILRS